MHRNRPFRWTRLLVVAASLAFLVGGDAGAKKYNMSGTWQIRNGQAFIPLGFALPTSMGDWTNEMGIGFPNGPIPGGGLIDASQNQVGTLMIPPSAFGGNFAALFPLNGSMLFQITTNFTIGAPIAAATLVPGGGPGDFVWCWNEPGCLAMGGNFATDPPRGMTTPTAKAHVGRVIYNNNGPNQFGGVIQVGLLGFGDNAIPVTGAPPPPPGFRLMHFGFGQTATPRTLAPGGGANDAPTSEMVYLGTAGPSMTAGFITAPIGTGMTGYGMTVVTVPGPKVTVAMGLTTGAPPNTVLYIPGQFTTNYGFPATTGTVIVQQSTGTGGRDFFTVQGSDNRTALGAGNITVVSGGMSRRNGTSAFTRYSAFHKISMVIGPMAPSMSPAGFAAAAILMVLAVGYAMRRRVF